MFTKGQAILRDLGNGLVMRRSTPEDADALAEFNGAVHGDNEADKQRVAAWTRDLLTRPHGRVRWAQAPQSLLHGCRQDTFGILLPAHR